MANQLNHVNAGDLITHGMWDDLVDAINDLEDRVILLEVAQGKVVITDLVYSEPLHLGDTVEILGRNFGFSSGVQQVSFDAVPITEFPAGCRDTRLVVKVPTLANYPESGRNVILTVGNGTDSTTRTLFIIPYSHPISGDLVDVIWESITPNPFNVGDSPRIGYRLHSRVGEDRDFTIGVSVSRTELLQEINVNQLQGTAEVPLSNNTIHLGSLQDQLFFVYLPAIPIGMVTGTSFTLTVSAVSGGVTGSDSRDLTVGEKMLVSDPNLTLSFQDFNAVDDAGDPVPEDGSCDSTTNTIQLRKGKTGNADLKITFQQAKEAPSVLGSYEVTISPKGTADGWTRTIVAGASIEIDQNDLDTGHGKASNPIQLQLSASDSAVASQIVVQVNRVGATNGERIQLKLALLA